MSDLLCRQHSTQIREALLLQKGVWSLAACHSRAKKQARLVERKVCFISDIGNCEWGWGECTTIQRLIPPHWQPVGQELFIAEAGGYSRKSTVISDSHLQIGHWWSDQCHLDSFRHS